MPLVVQKGNSAIREHAAHRVVRARHVAMMGAVGVAETRQLHVMTATPVPTTVATNKGTASMLQWKRLAMMATDALGKTRVWMGLVPVRRWFVKTTGIHAPMGVHATETRVNASTPQWKTAALVRVKMPVPRPRV